MLKKGLARSQSKVFQRSFTVSVETRPYLSSVLSRVYVSGDEEGVRCCVGEWDHGLKEKVLGGIRRKSCLE